MFYKQCSKSYFSNFRALNCFQSDDTRWCINTIWPDDEHDIAQNTYRAVINVLKNKGIVCQVGHLLMLRLS